MSWCLNNLRARSATGQGDDMQASPLTVGSREVRPVGPRSRLGIALRWVVDDTILQGYRLSRCWSRRVSRTLPRAS